MKIVKCYFEGYGYLTLLTFDFRKYSISAYSTDGPSQVFRGAKDRYNGITIDSRKEKLNIQKFTENLEGN